MLTIVLLVACITTALVLVLYLFYWNRLVGFALGLVVRLYFWNQNESSVWLDIGSVHFSILGGRILFRDLRYHSSNQTIRIVKGQLGWRYWVRAPAEEDDLVHEQVIGETNTSKAPILCRIHLKAEGFEWFIYNRTAAYDAIITAMDISLSQTPHETRPSVDGRSSLRKIFSGSSVPQDSSPLEQSVSFLSSCYAKMPTFFKRAFSWFALQLPNFDVKDLLPFSMEARTGAITIGNASTPSLLVTEFREAKGVFGVVPARSKHDLYRQSFRCKFTHASLSFVENDRFVGAAAEQGTKVHSAIVSSGRHALRSATYLSFTVFQKLWFRLQLWRVLSPQPKYRLSSTHSAGQGSWGRRRSQTVADDETPIGANSPLLEYAQARKVLETPLLELLYYVDIPGVVPFRTESPPTEDPLDIGNGDLPPEWGLDLAIKGGTIRYGPWADRQRTQLQQSFFPQSFTSAEPQPRLAPGDTRKWTALKVFIEMRDGVVLQIPFREPSKNWQWDGKAEIPDRPRVREAASIHVKAGDSSTIGYTMPFVASQNGYEPILEVHLDTVTVTSSLNDIRLLTAESCRFRGEMPSPLVWNGARTWKFAISLRQPTLYLLRDHINMLVDLGKDWSSGPPADFNRFIPMIYEIELTMSNYELNTYANDQNIIDKPLIKEENALLTLRGGHLQNSTRIPFTQYRPVATTASFWVDVPSVNVFMTLPKWNVHSQFSSPHRSHIGRIGFFYLSGSYRYHADVHSENIDNLKLRFESRDIVYKACGWTIRHFMLFRENYFGSFTHFSTLNEYIRKRKHNQPVGDPIHLQYRPSTSNAMTVELDVSVESGAMILPAGLPGYESYSLKESYNLDSFDMGACPLLVFPDLQLRLRTHDYYMEMSLNIDTVVGHVDKHCPEKLFASPSKYLRGKEVLVVDGISITANRLFGPQPDTTTYLCIWEINIVNVKALLRVSDGQILQAAGRTFGLNFSDHLNSPAAEFSIPPDPDVTFLKFRLGSVNVVWNVDGASVVFSLPSGLRIDSNDLPGKSYGKVTSIRIPNVSLQALLVSPLSSSVWYEAMSLSADGNLDIYSAPPGWKEKAQQQAEFIAKQDSHTWRARFMYMPESGPPPDQLLSGRGMLDNELFLPQLRVPCRTASTSTSRDAHRSANPPSLSTKTRIPQLHSESDGDDDTVELDYDTQLANSRPTNPRVARDDESIFSGDESDDDGLTDDSSGTEDYNSTTGSDTWPLLADYSYWTTRYGAHCLEKPSLWDSSPYYLSRECIFRSRPLVRKRKSGILVNTALEQPIQDPDRERDTTIIRFTSPQGISVWLTPLTILVAERLVEDISTHQPSPELRFDYFIADHIKAFSPTQSSRKALILDVTVPLLDVTVAQAVSPMEANRILSLSPHSPRSDVLSSIALELHSVQLKGRMESGLELPPNTSLSTSFDLVAVKLLDREASSGSRDTAHAACDIKIDFGSAHLLGSQAALSLGRVAVEIEHSAPELALASAASVLRCTKRLEVGLKTLPSAELDRRIICEVVSLSRGRSIVDPLSTIQPSFLIQSGRPHNIRRDRSFRLLIHLRTCLRHLEPDERRSLHNISHEQTPVTSAEGMQTIMEEYWTQHDMDPHDKSPTHRSALHKLFPQLMTTHASPIEIRGKSFLDRISLQLKQLRLTLSHPQDAAYSEVYVRFLVISGRARSMKVVSTGATSKLAALLSKEREKDDAEAKHIAFSLSTGDVGVNINPQLLNFIQLVVRVQRHYLATVRPTPVPAHQAPKEVIRKNPPLYQIDIALSSKSLRMKAAAEKLIIEYKTTAVTYSSTTVAKHVPSNRTSWELFMTHALTFSEVKLQACSIAELSKSKDYAVLASVAVTGGQFSVLLQQEQQAKRSIRTVFHIQEIHLNVPRSAMRLYRFAEEWRADYLPGLNATMSALLSELGNGRTRSRSISSKTSTRSAIPDMNIHASLLSFRVSLQVMHGTWVSWQIRNTIAYLTAPRIGRRRVYRFGLQVASQNFRIASGGAQESIRAKADLPRFTVTGSYDGTRIGGLALVDFFSLTVKPRNWDTLLSVQQKFGQDFHDFVALLGESRRKKASSPEETNIANKPKKASLKYELHLKMQGFKIGLESLASTLVLECEDIRGEVTEDTDSKWRLNLHDLSLSLASHATMTESKSSQTNRSRRSAFVTVNCALALQRNPLTPTKQLEFRVTQMHAVMQPSSIGELGDYIDHLQAEVLVRKEKRAKELEEFKAKTRSVMRSLDVKIGDTQTSNDELWWDAYIINVNIQDFGVAFPLSLTPALELPRSGSVDEKAVRAFLFSIKSIVFGTHRGQSGEVKMLGFSFQFVQTFHQSKREDFCGERQSARNRLLYPEMKAQIRTERLPNSRRIYLLAHVDGFILDIDTSMPDYVHSLIDVYRHGKERVERLAMTLPRTAEEHSAPITLGVEEGYDSLLTSNILASMTFASGKVRMYGPANHSYPSRPRATSQYKRETVDSQMRELDAEVFNLPVVSVWAEYHATPATNKVSGPSRSSEPSTLLFKSTIHSSQNTIRPTLLPFLTEFVSRVEDRMRKATWRDSHVFVVSSAMSTISQEAPTIVPERRVEAVTDSPTNSMRISLSLRIDQSKLELTCQPDVNVIAGLHWESGGFMVNISPGARRVVFSGSVGGLTIGLKHGFLSDDCVRLNARDLAFTMNFSKPDSQFGTSASSLSLVVDTEFSGAVRFSRLQDVLCFKAVWLDRIPVLNSQTAVPPSAISKATSHHSSLPPQQPKQELVTMVVLRLRAIRLDVDLGQSISSVKLRLDNAIIRTKVTEQETALSLSVAEFSVNAIGNLSGDLYVPNFRFQTLRKRGGDPDDATGGRMLDLCMTSGPLSFELNSEFQKLVHYRADPLTVTIYDDWSMLSPKTPAAERRVRLAFLVSGADLTAVMNIGTIPKLVLYATKFKINLDAQKDGASRESRAFRLAMVPRSDNLSAVANAMLATAKSRIKEAGHAFAYAIGQRLSIELDTLQLVVFPRTMLDREMAQFIGRNIHAQLHRVLESNHSPANRTLHLAFSSMAISKISQLNHALATKEKSADCKEWVGLLSKGATEATIFGLPSMDMVMQSDETAAENVRTIEYDFNSSFTTRDGTKDPEDIYISLNMSLYSWLTILRKSFAREMDQVQFAAELQRNLTSLPPTGLPPQRKQPPEPLDVITDSGRSLESSRFSASSSLHPKPPTTQDIGSAPITSPTLKPPSPLIQSPPGPSDPAFPEQPPSPTAPAASSKVTIVYKHRKRNIERLTMRQLGEATPDVMHPFFTKKAGFSLEESLPQYVHEYATLPTEEIMKALLKLYSRQLKAGSINISKSSHHPH